MTRTVGVIRSMTAVVATLLLVRSCAAAGTEPTTTGAPGTTHPDPRQRVRIVAIGDSFTQGEGVASIYNAELAAFAAAHGFTYVDVTTPSLAQRDDPALVALDGLHASPAQHARWVDILLPLVTDLAEANVAAVNYHFGSKEQLLRAVTDRIVEPLNARRRQLLTALRERRRPPCVAELLEAFIRPDVEAMQALERRRPVVRFVGRIYADDAPWIREMALAQFAEIADEFVSAIKAALPDIAAAELEWRLRQVVAIIVNLFTTYPDEGLDTAQAEATIARLVAFLAPAMSAPSPGDPEEVPSTPS